jgi:hypothetical protein
MKFLKLAGVLAVAGLISGCGNSGDSDTTYTSKNFSGVISLTNVSSDEPTSNFMLWIQNRGSKRVYYTDINNDGSFTLDVEVSEDLSSGADFFAGIVQKEPFKFLGPITFPIRGSEAGTGLKFNGDVSGVAVDFDVSKGIGEISTENAVNLGVDAAFKTRISGGKPVGVGNNGKGSGSFTDSLNTANTIDQDEDGIPDMFDAMNNGRDLDNKLENGFADMTAHSGLFSKGSMFMNMKVDEGSSFSVTDNASVVLQLQSDFPSNISSIKAKLVHTNYQSATIDKFPNGFTQVDTYPTEGSLWSSGSFRLYKSLNLEGKTVWTVFIKPGNNSFGPGQLILLEVTKTTGKKEYLWMSLNFKFTDILTDASTWSLGGDGTRNNPYIIPDTGDLTLSYLAPKDESGNDLTDVKYSFEMFFYDSGDQQVGSRQVINVGKDILTGTLTAAQLDLYASSNPKYVQIDLTGSYPYGDNAALKVYVKRASW